MRGKLLWKRIDLLISLGLILAVFAAYRQVLSCGFIQFFDDGVFVLNNKHIHDGLTFKGLQWAMTTGLTANWHPLTWVSHMLDCTLYGLKPWGHHLTSLLIHIANTVILYLLFYRITGDRWKSALVAALFGLHPVHVESAAWVSERKDVLSTLFWFLTTWAYVRYAEKLSLGRYGYVLLLFALGLMSKPMLVTLPCTLLLLDIWPLGRFSEAKNGWKRLVLEKIPMFLMVAAASMVTMIAQQGSGAVSPLSALPLDSRISNALVAYWRYVGKSISPLDLAAFYPYPAEGLPVWQVLGASLLLVISTVWLIRSGRKHPYLAVGWLWYLVTLVPVIGLVQVGAQSMADRYTYVPLIGIFVMAVWGVSDLLESGRARYPSMELLKPKYAWGLTTLVLLGFSLLTSYQVGYWKDGITLFEHALSVTEDRYSYRAHFYLGKSLAVEDRTAEAIEQYNKALELRPYSGEAHNSLGLALAIQGQIDQALAEFQQAVQLESSSGEYHFNLATTLFCVGDYSSAWEQVKLAEKYKFPPNPVFIKVLSSKMPDPGRG